MSLNFNEIDCVLNELNLPGMFVQEIVQPGYDSIAIYTYRPGEPKTVYISLAAGACRINETRRKVTKNEKPLRFNELLRSKIKGARILSCEQIRNERIIKITLEKAGAIYVMPKAQEHFAKKSKQDDESAEDEIFNLYIRLWSNAGNIFLCDKDDVILDSFYRRPAKNEMKGEKFVLPEPKESSQTREFPVREFLEVQESHPDKKLSFNEKVDLFYSENAESSSLESLLEQAEKWYNSHRSRQALALEKLKEKKTAFLNAGSLKHLGDLILAYGYAITSEANFIEAEDWENNNEIVKIKVDPKKSAQENASDYYEKYKKSVSGLENLDHDIEMAEESIKKLDDEYAKMISEKNPIKLEQVLRKTQKPKQQEKKSHPGLDYLVSGWQIIVGRDADENDDLLRHYVKGADMWLHVRDFHGGYVFIKNRPGKTVPLEILLYAGNLAVYYSKARKNGKADLYYTQVKHLRRAKNGPKGLVLPTNEKNLFIKLDEQKLRELERFQNNS
ncbi:NFACT RNA binding domain-containing protein [Treponema zioleckii]|uniref:NFACT RNA binding domain-containing protein n=1 Tax=Treponema zioleckii TaxID=331680 RepID=UPI00168AA5A0|nr:NFACT RNA binding domain-containing protein [Treponema zioleckii]